MRYRRDEWWSCTLSDFKHLNAGPDLLAIDQRGPVAIHLAHARASLSVAGRALGAAGDERHDVPREPLDDVAPFVGDGDAEDRLHQIVRIQSFPNGRDV